MSQAPAAAPAARPTAGRGRNLELSEELKAYKGVWVFIEHDRGHVHSVSWELVGEARKLADQPCCPVSWRNLPRRPSPSVPTRRT